MLEVLKFFLEYITKFVSMLFTIDVGFTNLGVMLCIVNILFPILLVITNFLKSSVFNEFQESFSDIKSKRKGGVK